MIAARRKGWSLIEIVIAAALLSLLIGMALQVTWVAGETVGEGLERSETNARANRFSRLIEGELRNAAGSTVQLSGPSPSSGAFTRVAFRQAAGFDTATSELALGPRMELRFEVDGSENWTASPVDDDGDLLLDEGSLVLYRDANDDDTIQPSERLATLIGSVAGESIEFRLPSGGQTPGSTDTSLDITFAVQKRVGRELQVERRDLRVALRN